MYKKLYTTQNKKHLLCKTQAIVRSARNDQVCMGLFVKSMDFTASRKEKRKHLVMRIKSCAYRAGFASCTLSPNPSAAMSQESIFVYTFPLNCIFISDSFL
jgi:hypothetical protein